MSVTCVIVVVLSDISLLSSVQKQQSLREDVCSEHSPNLYHCVSCEWVYDILTSKYNFLLVQVGPFFVPHRGAKDPLLPHGASVTVTDARTKYYSNIYWCKSVLIWNIVEELHSISGDTLWKWKVQIKTRRYILPGILYFGQGNTRRRSQAWNRGRVVFN